MNPPATLVPEQVARELRLQPGQVQRAVDLPDDANTIPFIARYRKEVTGGSDVLED